ncbi:MAG: hypothetical protein APF80_14000 [Alphaproteobacteria bacterium BRH_c36]|nr:MAG: hypothetical protein APF80_14000 [Alphaproteobacteria bacterium BRH_c36]
MGDPGCEFPHGPQAQRSCQGKLLITYVLCSRPLLDNECAKDEACRGEPDHQDLKRYEALLRSERCFHERDEADLYDA